MRRTIPVVATTLVSAAVLVTAAFGPNVASGQTDIHLVGLFADASVRLVDVHDDGLAIGDRGVVRQPLLDATGTTPMGIGFFDCVIVRGTKGDPRLWLCDALLKLEGGQLILKGLDPAGSPSEGRFAITGGTGIYANAQGDGTWTDLKNETRYLIQLTA